MLYQMYAPLLVSCFIAARGLKGDSSSSSSNIHCWSFCKNENPGEKTQAFFRRASVVMDQSYPSSNVLLSEVKWYSCNLLLMLTHQMNRRLKILFFIFVA